MDQFKIGGVPEHFNFPWHDAMEKGLFLKENINLQWEDYSGGTGAMCAALREGKLDIAILLTEGIIADITKGNQSKIIQVYVSSPLIWGIHVPVPSSLKNISDIQGKKYAISRLGSGSHLMAFVDAKMRGYELKDQQLVLVNNLEGARKALKSAEADVFFWEKFMTKPYVDNGEFRRLAERETPWPCFVIAVRNEILEKYPGQIQAIQQIINSTCSTVANNTNTAELIAGRYNLNKKDIEDWLKTTKWATDNLIEKVMLEGMLDNLSALKIISSRQEPEFFMSTLAKLS